LRRPGYEATTDHYYVMVNFSTRNRPALLHRSVNDVVISIRATLLTT